MVPSCLRVDKATIFFRSVSTRAEKPATSLVVVAKNVRRLIQGAEGRALSERRIMRKTPAVTKVEE